MPNQSIPRHYRTLAWMALAFTSALTTSPLPASQADQPMPNMNANNPGHACDEMTAMGNMSVMGESMAAMANHMCITPLPPKAARR
jgi:hypothetical protein